ASQEEDLLGDLFSGDGGGAAAAAGEAGHEPQPPEQGAAHAQSAGPTPNAGGSEAAAEGPMPPAVPLARKLAKDHGLDLRTLTPTGPHGTVRVKDVKEAITASGAQRVGAESPPDRSPRPRRPPRRPTPRRRPGQPRRPPPPSSTRARRSCWVRHESAAPASSRRARCPPRRCSRSSPRSGRGTSPPPPAPAPVC